MSILARVVFSGKMESWVNSSVKILAQRTRLWLSPEGICYIGSFKNYKYQITNIKQITMTEIRKSKQCLVREGFGH